MIRLGDEKRCVATGHHEHDAEASRDSKSSNAPDEVRLPSVSGKTVANARKSNALRLHRLLLPPDVSGRIPIGLELTAGRVADVIHGVGSYVDLIGRLLR